MRKLMVGAGLALVVAVLPAFGQAPADPDHRFVYNTYQNGLAEIELGKLAQQKTQNAEVKQFGARLERDHGSANVELKGLAGKANIALPSEPDAKQKATYERLSKLSGAAFDRAFMPDMVSAHESAVTSFRQATSGKHADIKMWAAKMLPTIEEHLAMAKSINTAVGTSGTTTSPAR
jgi:putative membrane protein